MPEAKVLSRALALSFLTHAAGPMSVQAFVAAVDTTGEHSTSITFTVDFGALLGVTCYVPLSPVRVKGV